MYRFKLCLQMALERKQGVSNLELMCEELLEEERAREQRQEKKRQRKKKKKAKSGQLHEKENHVLEEEEEEDDHCNNVSCTVGAMWLNGYHVGLAIRESLVMFELNPVSSHTLFP